MIQQLSTSPKRLASRNHDHPVVLCASDDNYVKPLAVTLFSAATNLRPGSHLHVLLMDGGISESSWSGLKETLAGLPISVHVTTPDRQEVADLGVSHHITHTAYFRLLAARLLPPAIEKVIYLDSDTLVLDDLSELWNLDLEDQYCAAAIDVACPFIDASQISGSRRRSIPYLAAISPIRNWRQLGIEGNAPYFNSGVMILNLQRWREENVEQRLLGCLREHPKFVWCWDQYALNAVFAGSWKALPTRWNQGTHLFEYPDESCLPIAVEDFRLTRDEPALIHFTTEFKPWNHDPYQKYRPQHPLKDLWFEWLDKTAFQGWRPAPTPRSWQQWWTAQAVYWSRRATIFQRKLWLRIPVKKSSLAAELASPATAPSSVT